MWWISSGAMTTADKLQASNFSRREEEGEEEGEKERWRQAERKRV